MATWEYRVVERVSSHPQIGEVVWHEIVEVYYDDDDIFWGHCIIAHIDADGNPVDADIAG